MIKGICHTNLDDYQRETWPEEFVAVPRKSSKIESKSGKTLRVVDVTHTTIRVRQHNDICNYVDPQFKYEPYIKIELHK